MSFDETKLPLRDVDLYNSEFGWAQERTIPQIVKTRVEELLDLHDGEVALELGAGAGDISSYLQYHHPGACIISSDINLYMVQKEPKPAVVTRAQNLPIEDACLSKTYSLHTLEHIPDTIGALTELDRVTRPGGIGVHVFPHPQLLKEEGAIDDALKFELAKLQDVTGVRKAFALLKGLQSAWNLAQQLHPKKLTPGLISQAIEGTNWTIESSEDLFVPEERGKCWIVKLEKHGSDISGLAKV